jgi:hypothetical protein
MSRDSKDIFLVTGLTLLLAFGWFAYGIRFDILDALREWQRGPLPAAVTRLEFERAISGVPTASAEEVTNHEATPEPITTEEPKPESKPEPETPAIPADTEPRNDFAPALNLRVPFMIQAPQQIWDELHGEACEEASSIMLAAYYDSEKEITTEEAEARILDAVSYEANTFGYHLDTTAAETAQMLREHFDVSQAQAIAIDSIDDIKLRLNAGHPVIVPAYGKDLGNPNFRNGGPLYHMMVIKGYTDTHFITNDPGTRRGADYVYDFDTLWNAIHDWNGGDVQNGAKVMIAVQ